MCPLLYAATPQRHNVVAARNKRPKAVSRHCSGPHVVLPTLVREDREGEQSGKLKIKTGVDKKHTPTCCALASQQPRKPACVVWTLDDTELEEMELFFLLLLLPVQLWQPQPNRKYKLLALRLLWRCNSVPGTFIGEVIKVVGICYSLKTLPSARRSHPMERSCFLWHDYFNSQCLGLVNFRN